MSYPVQNDGNYYIPQEYASSGAYGHGSVGTAPLYRQPFEMTAEPAMYRGLPPAVNMGPAYDASAQMMPPPYSQSPEAQYRAPYPEEQQHALLTMPAMGRRAYEQPTHMAMAPVDPRVVPVANVRMGAAPMASYHPGQQSRTMGYYTQQPQASSAAVPSPTHHQQAMTHMPPPSTVVPMDRRIHMQMQAPAPPPPLQPHTHYAAPGYDRSYTRAGTTPSPLPYESVPSQAPVSEIRYEQRPAAEPASDVMMTAVSAEEMRMLEQFRQSQRRQQQPAPRMSVQPQSQPQPQQQQQQQLPPQAPIPRQLQMQLPVSMPMPSPPPMSVGADADFCERIISDDVEEAAMEDPNASPAPRARQHLLNSRRRLVLDVLPEEELHSDCDVDMDGDSKPMHMGPAGRLSVNVDTAVVQPMHSPISTAADSLAALGSPAFRTPPHNRPSSNTHSAISNAKTGGAAAPGGAPAWESVRVPEQIWEDAPVVLSQPTDVNDTPAAAPRSNKNLDAMLDDNGGKSGRATPMSAQPSEASVDSKGRRGYTCRFCQRVYLHRTGYLRHERTHTGDRPFKCPTCSARFSQRGTLMIHMRRHTGERPYSCSACEQAFRHSGSARRHLKKCAVGPASIVMTQLIQTGDDGGNDDPDIEGDDGHLDENPQNASGHHQTSSATMSSSTSGSPIGSSRVVPTNTNSGKVQTSTIVVIKRVLNGKRGRTARNDSRNQISRITVRKKSTSATPRGSSVNAQQNAMGNDAVEQSVHHAVRNGGEAKVAPHTPPSNATGGLQAWNAVAGYADHANAAMYAVEAEGAMYETTAFSPNSQTCTTSSCAEATTQLNKEKYGTPNVQVTGQQQFSTPDQSAFHRNLAQTPRGVVPRTNMAAYLAAQEPFY